MRYLAASVRTILVAALFITVPPQSASAGAGVPTLCGATVGKCVEELNSQCAQPGEVRLDYVWKEGD